jgi:hypothetical protein
MKGIEVVRAIWDTAKNVIPITVFLIAFSVLVLKKPIGNWKTTVTGLLLTILGLHLFLKGASISLIPLGDTIGSNLIALNSKYLIIVFAFVTGYFGTLVEPALRALALEVEEVSVGAIRSNFLIHTVAIGFGLGMCIGMVKILNNIPAKMIIMPILIIVSILGYFTPDEFVNIAMDSASATTGPVNIPINMALAIGLSKILGTTDPLLTGFGLVGLTSLGTVMSVLVLGILSKV